MKILCIDGGGIRGVFAIAILQAIEKELGQPIEEKFDVIAGTSTGSIIATSACLQIEMAHLLHSYKKYGKKIFQRQAKVGLFKSVYSDKYLRKLLRKSFHDIKLKEVKKPLLIPTVDLTHGKPFVHRSNYGHPDSDDLSILVWDAVLSSCSAPVYFPPNNIRNDYLTIDGGLWANNPSLVCLTEGLQFFRKNIQDIKILSIGTGQQKIDFTIDHDKYWGVKKWLPFHLPSLKVKPKLLDLALQLSSESVTFQCQTLLGENYLRLNEELGREIPFDDLTCIEELIQLGKALYEKEKTKILNFIE
ncbi:MULTISPECIES: CBASS cGAMP-activated phospholipase [Bacillus]|uniref:CBASS cGAMP-activated phospholipase n=1 Tax=Bacillus TaxID=1386 RepID=UPI000BB762E1|nr:MULTISPECIES: CBASS cGAMP-activated phospholipase [Bacillus]